MLSEHMKKPLAAIATAAYMSVSPASADPVIMYGNEGSKQPYQFAGADGMRIRSNLHRECTGAAEGENLFAKYIFNEGGDYALFVTDGDKCIVFKRQRDFKTLDIWSKGEDITFVDGYSRDFAVPDEVTTKRGSTYNLGTNFFEGNGPRKREHNHALKKAAFDKYHEITMFLNVDGIEKAIEGKTPKVDQKEIDDIKNF